MPSASMTVGVMSIWDVSRSSTAPAVMWPGHRIIIGTPTESR